MTVIKNTNDTIIKFFQEMAQKEYAKAMTINALARIKQNIFQFFGQIIGKGMQRDGLWTKMRTVAKESVESVIAANNTLTTMGVSENIDYETILGTFYDLADVLTVPYNDIFHELERPFNRATENLQQYQQWVDLNRPVWDGIKKDMGDMIQKMEEFRTDVTTEVG